MTNYAAGMTNKEIDMGNLSVFNFITLNGFFEGPNRDISWHKHDADGSAYAAEGLKSGNTLLFGRVTYELMAGYWPTPQAIKNDPVVAEGMNSAEKIVFSKTLTKTDWKNTRVVKDNMADEIKKLKAMGKNMTILGSGSIVTQLTDAGLIDEYQFMVDPVILESGTPIFKGLKNKLNLKLTASRIFKNGSVLLFNQPI